MEQGQREQFTEALTQMALFESRAIAAALAIAAVPATNWPASVALCFGIAACVLAFRPEEIRGMAGRLTAIGVMAVRASPVI